MRAMKLFLQVLMSMVLAASADAGLNLQTLLVESPQANRRFCAAVGDVDSDGRNEVVVASTTDQTVRVLRFGLTGTWTEVDSVPVSVPPSWQVTSLSVLDMDADGDRDIALWLRANGQRGRLVVIFTQEGGRTVSTWVTPETDSCYAAAIADVNGDGLPDVVTCRHGWFTSESTAFVTWNANGPGRFSSHVALPIPWSPSVKTYVGDFDDDGNADLAIAAHPWGPVAGTLFLQRSPGAFEASTIVPGDGTKALDFAFGDLDADGDVEMVSDSSVPYVDWNRIHVYGLGTSLFPHSATLLSGPGVYQPKIGDFNGDGLADIVVDDRATATLRFFEGLAGGGVSVIGEVVSTPELLSVAHDPAGIGDQLAAGDVDNDGDLDLLLATDGLVWVRQLAGPPENPVAAFEYSPAVASPGFPVQFVDASTGSPVAWSWDFGDGQASADRNPVHSYASAGVFTVTLTVTNETATASATKQVLVNGPPVADAGPDRIVDAGADCRALVTLGSLC